MSCGSPDFLYSDLCEALGASDVPLIFDTSRPLPKCWSRRHLNWLWVVSLPSVENAADPPWALPRLPGDRPMSRPGPRSSFLHWTSPWTFPDSGFKIRKNNRGHSETNWEGLGGHKVSLIFSLQTLPISERFQSCRPVLCPLQSHEAWNRLGRSGGC